MQNKENKIRVALASDHAGFPLKDYLAQKTFENIKFINCGCDDDVTSVHYPKLANIACQKIIENKADFGVLVCGSGVGISIAANKYSSDIRAALCRDVLTAKLTRQHNNANILCLGAWFTANKLAEEIIKTFVDTKYEGGRHQIRIDMLKNKT